MNRPQPHPQKHGIELRLNLRRAAPASTVVSNRNSTPSPASISTSRRLSASGSLYSAMPYVFNPPGSARASKITAPTPRRLNSAAQANDAGPPPIKATFFPVASPASNGNPAPLACSASIANRCSPPIAIGCLLYRCITQAPSHSTSTGHAREQLAPKIFASKNRPSRPLQIPRRNLLDKLWHVDVRRTRPPYKAHRSSTNTGAPPPPRPRHVQRRMQLPKPRRHLRPPRCLREKVRRLTHRTSTSPSLPSSCS